MDKDKRLITYRDLVELKEIFLCGIRQVIKFSKPNKWLKSKDVNMILIFFAGVKEYFENKEKRYVSEYCD